MLDMELIRKDREAVATALAKRLDPAEVDPGAGRDPAARPGAPRPDQRDRRRAAAPQGGGPGVRGGEAGRHGAGGRRAGGRPQAARRAGVRAGRGAGPAARPDERAAQPARRRRAARRQGGQPGRQDLRRAAGDREGPRPRRAEPDARPGRPRAGRQARRLRLLDVHRHGRPAGVGADQLAHRRRTSRPATSSCSRRTCCWTPPASPPGSSPSSTTTSTTWTGQSAPRGQFLLPTSETAILGAYQDEILETAKLPLKAFAYTPCYRREAAGSHSDERGTVRGHQFNKVEIFQFTPARAGRRGAGGDAHPRGEPGRGRWACTTSAACCRPATPAPR